MKKSPPPLIESLGGRQPAWASPAHSFGSRRTPSGDFAERHYDYENESQETSQDTSQHTSQATSQETPRSSSSSGTRPKSSRPDGSSLDNIASFFSGRGVKPGGFSRPKMDIPAPSGASGLKKGQRVRHSKYGEGTILMREGDGEDAKLTIQFTRHGLKKLVEKFANLEKI